MIKAEIGDRGRAPAMNREATDSPPFGACAPNAFQRAVIGFTRRRKETWLGKRLCCIARRLVLTGLRRPLDAVVAAIEPARDEIFLVDNGSRDDSLVRAGRASRRRDHRERLQQGLCGGYQPGRAAHGGGSW